MTSLLWTSVLFVVLWSTQGRMLLRADAAWGFSTHSSMARQVSEIALLQKHKILYFSN
jgi:hypothetical protein